MKQERTRKIIESVLNKKIKRESWETVRRERIIEIQRNLDQRNSEAQRIMSNSIGGQREIRKLEAEKEKLQKEIDENEETKRQRAQIINEN